LAAVGVPNSDSKIECLRKVVALLPPGNQSLLSYLIKFLNKVAAKEKINKMTASNLAIVFAPTLYRPKEETFEIVIGDSQHANSLIETFIKSYQQIFAAAEKPVKMDEKIPQYQEFQKSMKKGTLRLARSFLEYEKTAAIQSTDEDLSGEEQKMMEYLSLSDENIKGTVTLDTMFDQVSQTTPWKPPIDRSTKYVKKKEDTITVQDLTPEVAKHETENISKIETLRGLSDEIQEKDLDKSLQSDIVVPENSFGNGAATSSVFWQEENLQTGTTNIQMKSQDNMEVAFSVGYLVSQLIAGNNLIVDNYLNTLDLNERSKMVDEMNAELTKFVI